MDSRSYAKSPSRKSTPAVSDAQAQALLDAPLLNALQSKRDRAVLATLLYHSLRRAELCGLSRAIGEADMTRTAIAFDFHVALVGAPEIWRRVRMQAHRSLWDLHEAICGA